MPVSWPWVRPEVVYVIASDADGSVGYYTGSGYSRYLNDAWTFTGSEILTWQAASLNGSTTGHLIDVRYAPEEWPESAVNPQQSGHSPEGDKS